MKCLNETVRELESMGCLVSLEYRNYTTHVTVDAQTTSAQVVSVIWQVLGDYITSNPGCRDWMRFIVTKHGDTKFPGLVDLIKSPSDKSLGF